MAAEPSTVPTCALWRLAGPWTWPNSTTASLAAVNAVSAVTRTRLTNIQKSATARPQKVIGTLSPYPTATVVTPAHQMPEPMPWAGRPANIALRRRSSSHIEMPARNTRTTTPA